MISFRLPVLLAMVAISYVVTTPLPGLTNFTLPSGIKLDWDPRLMTANVAVMGTQPLNMDSCLMATTKMLHQLSGHEFDGSIGPSTYVCRPFTAVAISARGVPGTSEIPVRLAVWGAALVGRWLAQYRVCSNIVFALVYDRSLVGYIEFTGTPVQLSMTASSNETRDDDTPTRGTAWNAELKAAAATHRPQPMALRSLFYDHQPLDIGFRELPNQAFTKFELFGNIYVQLAHIAAFPPRQRVESSWKLSSSAFPRSQTVFAPSGSPYTVEYRDAADAFIRTAFRVIQRRVVHGLAIRLRVAERFIARGLIWYPPRTES